MRLTLNTQVKNAAAGLLCINLLRMVRQDLYLRLNPINVTGSKFAELLQYLNL